MAQKAQEIVPDEGRPEGPVDHAQQKGEDFAHSQTFEWLARAGLVR